MTFKNILLFLLVIFSLKYFDATFAKTGMLKNLSYGYMALAVLISLPKFFVKKGGFVLPVQLISASVLLSLFMADYTWNQGLEYSPTTIPYLMWFFFFYLIGSNYSITTIENIVMIYGALYIVLFLFQFTHNHTVYFGTVEEFKEDRGIIRVNFPGGGVFFLSCFIAINKVTEQSKYKLLWLSYALLGIGISILQVTRQTIFALLLIYIIHFMKSIKWHLKIATVAVFLISFYLFINSDNPISRGLAEQQKTDTSAGGDYIRIQSAKYYLTQFTPNTISKIFGNGFFNDTSNYGKSLIALNENYGFYLTDVGLVEVYITFGIAAVLGYILIFIKSITIPLDSKHYYLKYYIWMISATAFTSDFIISYNYLITTIFVLVCYQSIYEANAAYDSQEISLSNIPT